MKSAEDAEHAEKIKLLDLHPCFWFSIANFERITCFCPT
jgi:hypothetical protein